ncbi:MAG: hypothetical protein CL943_00795 [Candidatus Diapherotrites archaeon]|uniref:TRASH domain-containing protein n=1 Tax=Candidatus Iainarchaeum sp. TaxID=3101447 RepID=A0A2D6M0A4_9ARCH|nr:hypothetical protein [Candidatus Diapherotrites archaeon]|tara:strand:+ start:1789 stop:1968 length:180 start_codon:yes stop_codon:yes gene_type:complete
MDFGKYIKKSNNSDNVPAPPKACRECGKEIDRERAGHLYYHGFCSHSCKEKYVGHELEE